MWLMVIGRGIVGLVSVDISSTMQVVRDDFLNVEGNAIG